MDEIDFKISAADPKVGWPASRKLTEQDERVCVFKVETNVPSSISNLEQFMLYEVEKLLEIISGIK